MREGFLFRLENEIPNQIFTDEDLRLIFSDKEEEQLHNCLSYHLRSGHIKRFKRGVYSLVANKQRSVISKFVVANFLYTPSYVSYESALSHFGLIPEAVYEVTSACYQEKKKIYKTPDGIFSFSYSPVRPFFLDVMKDEKESFLIASALRALFDLISMRRKLYDSLNDLEDDLRIDLSELKNFVHRYDAEEIFDLGDMYKKSTTRKLSEILVRGFK